MKKVLKCILGIIGICYFAIVIVVTACLLCYNQYKVTEMFGYTFVMIDDNSDMYNNGDLVLFQENELNDIRRNDTIFFYEVTNGVASIRYGTVTEIMPVTNEEKTFTINNNHDISSESLIGKTDTAKVVPKLGQVLTVLESRFGFLILVILPTLILFLYELYRVIVEIKTPIDDDEDE